MTADETDLAWLGLSLPLDDVDSSDVDLAGRFAEYLDRLRGVLLSMREPQPTGTWSGAFETALDLLTDVDEAQA